LREAKIFSNIRSHIDFARACKVSLPFTWLLVDRVCSVRDARFRQQ
jgi:hypothetical protein